MARKHGHVSPYVSFMEIERVHRVLGLPPASGISEELEQLLDLPERAINNLWHCRSKNQKAAAKLLRLARLLNAMEEIRDVIEPENRLNFLEAIQPALDCRRPVDLLNSDYGFQELIHGLDHIRINVRKSLVEAQPGVFEYLER